MIFNNMAKGSYWIIFVIVNLSFKIVAGWIYTRLLVPSANNFAVRSPGTCINLEYIFEAFFSLQLFCNCELCLSYKLS